MGLLLELRQRKRDSVWSRSPKWPKRSGNENGGSPPYNTVLLLPQYRKPTQVSALNVHNITANHVTR